MTVAQLNIHISRGNALTGEVAYCIRPILQFISTMKRCKNYMSIFAKEIIKNCMGVFSDSQ